MSCHARPRGWGSSKLKVWENKPLNTWAPLFTTLFNGGDNRANLLRVFLMNGFGIIKNPDSGIETPNEVYPFILAGNNSDRRWLVKKAITAPQTPTNWNAVYFTRLKAFAEQAKLKGVFLQLSLFNYYEMSNDTWNFSIWNPARSDDRDWGAKNLVNPQLPNPHPPPATFACSNARSTAEGTRHCFFVEAPLWSGLRKVQEQFVRKVVRELHGKPNIILEVMNEPRGGSHESSARFASTVIDWIIDEGHPRALRRGVRSSASTRACNAASIRQTRTRRIPTGPMSTGGETP